VAVGANTTATFSRIVQGVSTGTNSTNVRLFQGNPANNIRVAANVTVALGLNLTINPTADLAPSTLYTVVITGGTCTTPTTGTGIRTLVTPCAALATTSWSFTTEIANPAPTVIATNPVANATNVVRRGPPVITATFSEDVQGVNGTTATIARTGGTPIAATVVYNAATRTVSITPAANLRANTSFTVTLRGGATAIRDLTNKPLVTRSWSFTTGA